MDYSTELVKGSTKALILSTLAEEDMYGYQIIRHIKTKSEGALELGEGTIYPILHKLERDKYLKSYWEKQDSGPDRKYYKITARGKRHLKSHLKEWGSFTESVNKVLNGYFNG